MRRLLLSVVLLGVAAPVPAQVLVERFPPPVISPATSAAPAALAIPHFAIAQEEAPPPGAWRWGAAIGGLVGATAGALVGLRLDRADSDDPLGRRAYTGRGMLIGGTVGTALGAGIGWGVDRLSGPGDVKLDSRTEGAGR